MDQFHQQLLLFFSLPIYAVLIPLEIYLSNQRQLRFYSVKETLMNIYLNLVNSGIDLLLRAIALVILYFFYNLHLVPPLQGLAYWTVLFLGEDFLFWLVHYVDHNCRLFWAVHVTHHSSTEYNLTTGFRSSVFMPFYRFIYFIPLALAGFRPIDILFMYAITQLYGILVHTQYIKKLPRWVEFIFVTPSHHRVHHASNIPYLDKNMGMALIIWDRIFGTFAAEQEHEPPVYGLTKNVDKPYHPTRIIFHEWAAITNDLRKKTTLANKLRYLFMPPGWSHDGSTKTARELQQRLD
ncbi:MAG: sterol desaturase family protein [Chitinophagia bacterium]|nr:sterol desaturase family protein [Chitinophagia bacterium]